MIDPQRAGREANRLAQLDNLNILDTPIEQAFERITRIVARVMASDIAGISLVDKNRVWFKSIHGADLIEIPRNQSFCATAIEQAKPLIVEDAHAAPKFRNLEVVTGAPFVRSYVGAPISLTSDVRIGAVCIFSSEPATFEDEDVTFLEDMAATAAAILRNRLIHNLTR